MSVSRMKTTPFGGPQGRATLWGATYWISDKHPIPNSQQQIPTIHPQPPTKLLHFAAVGDFDLLAGLAALAADLFDGLDDIHAFHN